MIFAVCLLLARCLEFTVEEVFCPCFVPVVRVELAVYVVIQGALPVVVASPFQWREARQPGGLSVRRQAVAYSRGASRRTIDGSFTLATYL